LSLEWNLNRTLSKINYRIHTDAIKEYIIPENLSKEQISFIYASETDVLNMAFFGQTAKKWITNTPEQDGIIRDNATLEQLLVLANLESLNTEFIRMELEQPERIKKLNQKAITQIKSLSRNREVHKLSVDNQEIAEKEGLSIGN